MVNRQFHSVSDYLFDRFALRYVEFIKKSQNQPLVGEAGFEPARPKPHAPKACASTIPPLPRSLNSTFGRLLVDVRHLPGVERFEDGGGALGSQGYADAVVPSGVDPRRAALLVVDEYLDDARVDEDAGVAAAHRRPARSAPFRHSPAL